MLYLAKNCLEAKNYIHYTSDVSKHKDGYPLSGGNCKL